MRYKAKRKDNNETIEGYIVETYSDKLYMITWFDECDLLGTEYHEIYPETVKKVTHSSPCDY